MNITVWILQILLALHTGIGAIWKFSHSAVDTMPSLGAIPGSVWTALGVAELVWAVCLIVPILNRRLNSLVPIAAVAVAVEMLVFSGLHFASGAEDHTPVIYWFVVAAISFFVAYGAKRRSAAATA